jgi:hypothetical protein
MFTTSSPDSEFSELRVPAGEFRISPGQNRRGSPAQERAGQRGFSKRQQVFQIRQKRKETSCLLA